MPRSRGGRLRPLHLWIQFISPLKVTPLSFPGLQTQLVMQWHMYRYNVVQITSELSAFSVYIHVFICDYNIYDAIRFCIYDDKAIIYVASAYLRTTKLVMFVL